MQQTENLAPHVQEITRALQNRVEPEAVEDELRRYLEFGVPLVQAKRDIVRMHGGSLNAGSKQIADLAPEDRGLELTVHVVAVSSRDVTVRGEAKTIWSGVLGDASGKVAFTSWKEQPLLQKGHNVHVKNVYAKPGFRGGLEVNVGDYATIEKTHEQVDVKDAWPHGAPTGGAAAASGDAGGSGSGRMSVEKKARDLRDGMGSVTLTGRVLDLREKNVSTARGETTLVEGDLADDTGRVAFACWDKTLLPEGFQTDAVVRIRNGYVRSFRGVPNFNFGNNSQIEILTGNELPDRDSLLEEKPFDLGQLEEIGGGQGVQTEGVVLEVKKGSGLIFRCPADGCNRVLQRMECRIHGRQKGVSDLRVKAVLDDGTGAATFFANRDATEALLGKTLAECETLAREAMTVDVIQDEITEKITGRRVVVKGNATSDEYGLQIMANAVDYVGPRDVQPEAERLLGQVLEVLQEVSE